MRRPIFQLIVVCVGLTIGACDSDSPVQPREPDASSLSLNTGSSGIIASPVSPTEIDLSWRNTGNASGYQIFRSDNGATGSFVLIASTPASVTSYANTGLMGSTQYCYEIRSFRTAGRNTTYSAYSNVECATTFAPPINAPSGVNVVPMPNGWFVDPYISMVRVSWTDNSANEDGFRVEHASAPTGPWTTGPWPESVTTPANVTSLGQSGEREKQVCFRVIAFNAVGVSNPSSADCTTPPANPTNLLAKATDGQSINLTWTDNSAVEDGYKVSRLDAAGTWADIAMLPSNTVSYRDAGVTVDRTYTYRVQALKDGGFSDYTNESAAVIPTAPPAAPYGASASYWADNEYGWLYFGVAWTDGSNNEEGFRIEYSGDGVGGWDLYTTAAANETSIQVKLSLWDTPLGGRGGCYRVIAVNGAGGSTPSNVTCTEWANAPTNLAATAVDQQGIDLSWTDNGTFENGYVVFRSTSVDGQWDVVAVTPANTTSYHDTGLASGQEYWYFIAADFGGYSIYDMFNYSDRVSATTLSATGATQSSTRVINSHLTPIRIRGRLTLQDVRARFNATTGPSLPPVRQR
jgi:hypothetical protein